ncbi:MAG: hypothetical protein NT007_09770 [Candidatus Kapabacteria bacterium]|nr:hypothetical protein [Candidatus Kapabacteria bacterium]
MDARTQVIESTNAVISVIRFNKNIVISIYREIPNTDENIGEQTLLLSFPAAKAVL